MPHYRLQTDREADAFVRGLIRRFLIAIALSVGIVMVSTVGLLAFGRHQDSALGTQVLLALWDTLNLVSTVGNIEEQFTVAQRVWAMVVIVFGLGAILYGFGTLQGLLHGGEVYHYLVRKRMERALKKMSGHVIVCGLGFVGRGVARRLRDAEQQIVAIEHDPETAAVADDDERFLVIQGDATDERSLRAAGIERAGGLVAALDTDAANVFLILIARELNPGLRIVARADRPTSRSALRQAGADRIIVPSEIAGHQLSHFMVKPHATEFIDSAIGEGELGFAEIAVDAHPLLQEKPLRELQLPRTKRVIVISIIDEHGEQEFNPGPDRVLHAGETLLAVGNERDLLRLAAEE